ncbi:putative acyl-activating enzyme 19 [Phalaenopsis equestris]|uniref:putative acyl-activating enzyme 19 n=1 Tax=Phalaenopsis equestris TaxID=78828 RepID=UPI0009E54456|nr:putative acyl-activating enzyme 19 [Phalaenopsis equestris]
MPGCCISHEFFISATKDPRRVAIVQADGGLFRDSRARLKEASSSSSTPVAISSFDLNFDADCISSSPRLFPGDECFTYEELLSAVDSLSRRIRFVLDGGDAAHHLNHPGYADYSPYGFDLGEFDGLGLPSTSYVPRIVGVQIGPSVEYIVAVLSILRCGEAFLPLDPSWPEERILSVVSSSRSCLVIQVKADSTMQFEGRQMNVSSTDWVVDRCGTLVLYFSMKEKFVKSVAQFTNLAWPCESNRQRKFCYLMYSSGSTGEPKGVCGTELGLLNRYWWMQDQYPISREDVLLFKTSISFVDHLQEFLGAIMAGALLVIPTYQKLKYPEYAIDFVKAYGISRLTTVPSLLRELFLSFDISLCAQFFNSLKVLIFSGEVLPISLWRDLRDHLPQTTILNLYGSTEVAGDCAFFDCKKMTNILEAGQLSSVPIGQPISNCEINLLDKKSEDNVGEICVTGMCLFAGYLGEISDEQPLNDGCAPLHFKTGDIARRLPSGDFVFLGRNDRIVKVRGQRIVLEEIENVLREHPDIRDAAVIFENTNGNCDLVKAFFVVKAINECSEGVTCVNKYENEELIASIKSWLLRKLPTAMLPAIFVQTEMLPKSFSGKVDYSKLGSSRYLAKRLRRDYEGNISDNHRLQVIKKVIFGLLFPRVRII